MDVLRRMGWSKALLAVFILVACSSAGGDDALGGDALPVQNPSESYAHTSGDIEGLVTLETGGCWTIDLGDGKRLAVFPAGYTKDDGGNSMTSADGEVVVGDGDTLVAVGGVAPAAGFPGVPDGYWGNYLTFCQPPIEEFVVIDQIVAVNG